MCKRIILILFISIFVLKASSQTEKVKGVLSTTDTADLIILNIYPDSFPAVSVLFKAETRKGEPVWSLTKEKMRVKENSSDCKVISLEQISKNKPVNLGIVIDHSGSMLEAEYQQYGQNANPVYFIDGNNNLRPKNYVAPIDNAKKAVKKFVTSFNSGKDYISIIGFSSTVDKILPLTQNSKQINSIVDSMQADYSTALYDAMIAGMEEIRKSDGIKVLVALTDGQDNVSISTWKDVANKAVAEQIPVYIIGLGNVNKDTLQMIAEATKGQFYFTKSSSSLDTVYLAISKKVQAFYDLTYRSSNMVSSDSTRELEISFDIDSIYLETNPAILNLPTEVVSLMKRKEREKKYLIYGSIAVATLIITGTILFTYRRKRKNQPVIKKLFPNPTNGNMTVEFFSTSGQLQIFDLKGQLVTSIQISGNEKQFNLSELPNGTYLAVIQANGQKSNAEKFIIQH
jgi:Ca-activated chloride channel family protein